MNIITKFNDIKYYSNIDKQIGSLNSYIKDLCCNEFDDNDYILGITNDYEKSYAELQSNNKTKHMKYMIVLYKTANQKNIHKIFRDVSKKFSNTQEAILHDHNPYYLYILTNRNLIEKEIMRDIVKQGFIILMIVLIFIYFAL